MIRFKCEHCDGVVRVGDSYAGKQGRCPSCDRFVTIPPAGQNSEPRLEDFELPSALGGSSGDTDILPAHGFAPRAETKPSRSGQSRESSEPARPRRSRAAARKQERTFTAVAIMLLLVAVVFLILVLRTP